MSPALFAVRSMDLDKTGGDNDVGLLVLYSDVPFFYYLKSTLLFIIIMAGMAVFLRSWLPHRGKAQMACNYCFPTRTMF